MTMNVAMIGPFPHMWGGRIKGGGAATHVQGLMSALPQYGVNLRILADNTDAARPTPIPELEQQIEIRRMIRPHGLRAPADVAALGAQRMARIVWKMLARPHLRRAAPLNYQLKFIGQAVNFEKFLSERTDDILHVHHAELRQYVCQQIVEHPTPLIATVHSANVLVRSYPAWLTTIVIANYRRADRLIAVSHYVKDIVIQHGTEPARITVIPNGVDARIFKPAPLRAIRERLGLPTEPFLILFTGNLIPRKGVDVLLKAFHRAAQKYPNLHLVLIGRGPEKENLIHLAHELNIHQHVVFAGYKPLTEMPLWYQACDAFVMPSWAEGLSLSVVEAMACGRPVITTHPDTGTHDAIIPDETGLLTHYGDVDELAHALTRLAASPQLAARLGDAARRKVEESFTWQDIARRTVEVYQDVYQEYQYRQSANG